MRLYHGVSVLFGLKDERGTKASFSKCAHQSEDDNNFVLKWFLRITRFPPPTFPSIRSLPSSFLPTSFADNADTISRFFPHLSFALFSFSSLFGENEEVLSSKKRDTSSLFSNTFHLLTVILILVFYLNRARDFCFSLLFTSHSREGRPKENRTLKRLCIITIFFCSIYTKPPQSIYSTVYSTLFAGQTRSFSPRCRNN